MHNVRTSVVVILWQVWNAEGGGRSAICPWMQMHYVSIPVLVLVWQVWNAEDGEDEVLAMVCRTGLNSQMGSMVRELVAPSKLPKAKDNFLKVGGQTANGFASSAKCIVVWSKEYIILR